MRSERFSRQPAHHGRRSFTFVLRKSVRCSTPTRTPTRTSMRKKLSDFLRTAKLAPYGKTSTSVDPNPIHRPLATPVPSMAIMSWAAAEMRICSARVSPSK